jgi:hypothetical protein
MQSLQVGLDSWIIQDGNYSDFRVGQSARFALEFYPYVIRACETRLPQCEHVLASKYRVCAQAVFTAPSVWVIDFGFKAYKNHPPPRFAAKGSWVLGKIYVGVDPFFYFEELHAIHGMPELRYDFRIGDIQLETTPWVQSKNQQGRTVLSRDDREKSFRPVAETNAWQDDEGRAHYVLECEVVHAV